MAEREYTTKGQGNLNTVLGAVGTAAAVMPNLFNGGIFGNGCNSGCSENTVVTRYEQNLVQEIAAAMNCMSGQIAQLFALTKLVVPNSSVCPGWGNVNITPATTPATA